MTFSYRTQVMKSKNCH